MALLFRNTADTNGWEKSCRVLLLVAVVALSEACSDDTPLRLTSLERTRVDTIFSREIRVIRPLLDSICEAEFDEQLQLAVDSILKLRKEEEVRLRARMQLQK